MTSSFLQNTLPANLFPLTWLLPSGKLFLQATWSTTLLDYRTKVEIPLDDMPDAIRTYPASAGTAMLPLTPANNWTATIMFCGGSNVSTDESVLLFKNIGLITFLGFPADGHRLALSRLISQRQLRVSRSRQIFPNPTFMTILYLTNVAWRVSSFFPMERSFVLAARGWVGLFLGFFIKKD